jgi:PhnB protein
MNGIPEGFHTLTPYMIIRDAARAIDFYTRAFGATQLLRLDRPDGKIMHAEIMIGNSPVMLADETADFPDMPSPQTANGSPITLFLYVENVDAFAERAVAAGATLHAPIKDEADGDRRGGLRDPFGFTWWIGTQKRVISRAEMQRMFDEQAKR